MTHTKTTFSIQRRFICPRRRKGREHETDTSVATKALGYNVFLGIGSGYLAMGMGWKGALRGSTGGKKAGCSTRIC
jgi:hypothetical protein